MSSSEHKRGESRTDCAVSNLINIKNGALREGYHNIITVMVMNICLIYIECFHRLMFRIRI